jgi:tetratricopeptide (TPR) repeat protein
MLAKHVGPLSGSSGAAFRRNAPVGYGLIGRNPPFRQDRSANMHYVARISLALTVGGYLQAVSAFAQTRQEWLLCLGQDFSSPDLPIKGCTAIIQTGRQVIDRLATAYNNRGVAYRLKAEYDKAIEDFNEAIRLRPNSPTTFNNRAVAYRNKVIWRHHADYHEAIPGASGDSCGVA